MQQLVKGVREFLTNIHPKKEGLFRKLGNGQSPHTMMVTCSDSRIDPALITQTEPGELFVIRNAGNMIPPWKASSGGEGASVEFGVNALKVRNIIVCGHACCGAMAALAKGADLSQLPATAAWLQYAEATRQRHAGREKEGRGGVDGFVEENVLVQVQNLKTHPAVSTALKEGRLLISGWVYDFRDGDIRIYSLSRENFISVRELGAAADVDFSDFEL